MTMKDSPPAPNGPGGIGGTGFELDDLSDYLDRGRAPSIPAIDNSAECRSVLSSLERVSTLSRELVARDAESHSFIDDGWLGSLLTSISTEAKAGRDIPLASPDARTRLVITEGAVRELVRAAGDSIPGALVGRCQLDGDPAAAGASVRVAITISVMLGMQVAMVAEAVRQRVYSQLLSHTELRIDAVDVTVVDVHVVVNENENSVNDSSVDENSIDKNSVDGNSA